MKKFSEPMVSINKHGSLLLEALLATVILSVSITLIIQSMVNSLRVVTDSARYTVALDLLDGKMVELIRGEYAVSEFAGEDDFPEPNDLYRYSLDSMPVSEGEDGLMSEADIQVSWRSGNRRNAVGLTTYVFDNHK